jgi:trans-aconitate 2-methyltransferase
LNNRPVNPTSDTVRAFYDEFMVSRMLRYRLHGNARIEKAIERILPFVTRDSHVLEVGCGIGLVTEKIARKAGGGFVFACDISKQNVWYARQTVKESNVEFRELDVLHRFPELQAWLPRLLDLVVMVDVLEHLPPEERPPLFSNLRHLLTDEATMVLTFPSPQYLDYLRRNNPGELQVIDEVIELPALLALANETGFALRHFSLEDVWLKNQYVHAVLQTSTELGPLPVPRLGRMAKIRNGLSRSVKARVLVPFRKRKYIKRVFRS